MAFEIWNKKRLEGEKEKTKQNENDNNAKIEIEKIKSETKVKIIEIFGKIIDKFLENKFGSK